jgi:CRISPR-associated protein Csh2
MLKQNSEFLFAFEAVMTNPNGDPDQENKPRMDYDTKTALVSDARRKRDCREFLKRKGYPIFVDTIEEQKVPAEAMFEHIVKKWMNDDARFSNLLNSRPSLQEKWNDLSGNIKKQGGYLEIYEELKKEAKKSELKKLFPRLNNELITAIIQEELIDVRLFGSAMAVENVTRTFTGPVQISWAYSLHPVELVKSNTITSIMNEDNSTFGKKHKLYYGLFMHSGTVNKYAAKLTGMTDQDLQLFRKALVQGMMQNQTDSKQGQTPLFYLEIQYTPEFDGFIGDIRKYVSVSYDENKPIRSLGDLNLSFDVLQNVIQELKNRGYIRKVVGWHHPIGNYRQAFQFEFDEIVDLWQPVTEGSV